ncbi:hypothetical protein [Streptomyces sp. NPDC048603]|uniref:hypothetical protein n=1 Tax=Streptomyces sp. NPDC048603 TaxID=3365577 RepID=UPI003720005E
MSGVPGRWFVESRGHLPEQDYVWQPAGAGGGDGPGAAELLARGCRGRPVYDLIDDAASSLLLYCAGDARPGADPLWLLLLTGLRGDGSGTGDHMGRGIRCSVLGTGSGPLPPEELLAVAREFLLGRLDGPLPVGYGRPAGTPGFAVDADGWAGLLERAVSALASEPPAPDASYGPYGPDLIRVDQDTPGNRRRAAASLLELTEQTGRGMFDPGRAHLLGGGGLPRTAGGRPLLVVTSLLGKDGLWPLAPLQALSRRVDRALDSDVRRENGQAAFRRLKNPLGGLLALTGLVLAAVTAVTVFR